MLLILRVTRTFMLIIEGLNREYEPGWRGVTN